MNNLQKTLKTKILDIESATGPAKYIINDKLAALGQVAWDYGDEIIAALKTVRGIKGLAKRRTGVHIYYQGGEWFVGETACSIDLSLAVDAAVGASEKGVKRK